MREIKFRQFIKGEWHYWGFLEKGVFVGPANNTLSEDEREESQQFTGLKDKNGKEIWEGDIIKFDTMTESKPRIEVGVVRWFGAGFVAEIKPSGCCDFWGCESEIIGNIYENSDLLHD